MKIRTFIILKQRSQSEIINRLFFNPQRYPHSIPMLPLNLMNLSSQIQMGLGV